MNKELKSFLQKIDDRKKQLDQYRPLPAETAASLREHQNLEWIYNSNAIEGNTLTLSETKVVLEGITIGGKSLNEHLEVVNHQDAIHFVEDLVAKKEVINEWNLKNIHQLVLKGIQRENAGRYRDQNVMISGSSHIPPDHLQVPEDMKELINWYENKTADLHPIEKAAQLHNRFVTIHPFVDGNGRTARLLMNFELMREGYPPAIIQKTDRPQYYDAVAKGDIDQHDDLTMFVAQNLGKTLNLYLEVITGQKQEVIEIESKKKDERSSVKSSLLKQLDKQVGHTQGIRVSQNSQNSNSQEITQTKKGRVR